MQSPQSPSSAPAVSPINACCSVCLLLWLSASCGLQPPSLSTTSRDLAGVGAARSSSVIARSELTTVQGTTAGDAVRQLRPRFLEASQQQLALRGQRVYPSVLVGDRPF